MTGETLETIRKQLGWTKRKLADRTGVTERTIHRYINNEIPISKSVEKLIKIYAGGYVEKEE